MFSSEFSICWNIVVFTQFFPCLLLTNQWNNVITVQKKYNFQKAIYIKPGNAIWIKTCSISDMKKRDMNLKFIFDGFLRLLYVKDAPELTFTRNTHTIVHLTKLRALSPFQIFIRPLDIFQTNFILLNDISSSFICISITP